MSSLGQTARKRLKSLATPKGRTKHGLFLAEGVRVLEESYKFGFLPQSVYFSETDIGQRGKTLVGSFARLGCETTAITGRELNDLAESVTPQGIIAVFKIPDLELTGCLSDENRLVLYLDNIADPGNVGTLIRSALAFGVDLTVLSPETVDPFNGKVVRSSAGAIFGQKLAVGSIDDLAAGFGADTLFLGAQKGGVPIRRILAGMKTRTRIIFAVGSEARGLSEPCLKRINHPVGIEHDEKVESLNAAVAGSIILKEIFEYLRGVEYEK